MTTALEIADALESDWPPVMTPAARKEIAALLREGEALRKDAERYRWLRNNNATIEREMMVGEDFYRVAVGGPNRWCRRRTLDDAIDLAMIP